MLGKPNLAMSDMMLEALQIDCGRVVTAGDSPDEYIVGLSRTGSTTLFGNEVDLHVREG